MFRFTVPVEQILGRKNSNIELFMSYSCDPMPQTPHRSPMYENHLSRGAYFLAYGTDKDTTEVVETFGDLDLEYAAIRKGCVIFDQPHIGSVRVMGADRGSFLNNMITAKVDDLKEGECRRAFWLNRKGRIDADLRIAQRKDDMLIAADRHLCRATAESLRSFVFAEDIEIEDSSDRLDRISIHGPTAWRLIQVASNQENSQLDLLGEYENTHVIIGGARVLIEREDLTGEVGLELSIAVEDTLDVYQQLISIAGDHPELKARPTGWLAINAARIEAGHPMFHVDFGDTNLPVESGIIEDRVSFTKGCYLGQEVVARMHARKACNKRVVAIRVEGERITTEQQDIHQPIGGSQIFEQGKEGETPIGSVTSSTISPMLGAVPICFAMVKEAFSKPGTKLSVSAEGKLVPCIVQDSLVFWTKADAHS